MRKKALLLLLLLGSFTLAACENNDKPTNPETDVKDNNEKKEEPKKDDSGTKEETNTNTDQAINYTAKNINMKSLDEDKIKDSGTYEIIFKENSEIPYISINDGVSILSNIRHERIDGKNDTNNGYAKLEMNGDNAVIKNDNAATCTISLANQTITFDDLDTFLNIYLPGNKPLMIANIEANVKAIKATNIEYTKGDAVTLSLNNYSKLDIVKRNDKLYIPVALYSSIFLSSFSGMFLGYNFDDLYLGYNSSFSSLNLEDVRELSAFGNLYYSGTKKDNVSAEYAAYTTDVICFDMDHFYGLKKDKNFTSFHDFLESKGYLADMNSGDVKKMDAALTYAIYDLNDGHTFITDYSTLYNFSTQQIDKTKLNKAKVDYDNGNEALKKAKIDASIDDTNKIYEDYNTMYITFSGFNTVNEKIIYSGNKHNDFVYALCNAAQFSDAYKTLLTKKDTIKNVVVDLTTNDGGASDGMIYALSVLIGEVSFDIYDPLSHGHTRTTYKADMNLDQKIDEYDVSLLDLGFNIIFLSSEYTFSSANAMVVGAKANKPSVITIGDKTGGGPCVVKNSATPLGTVYSSSGLNVISLKDGNEYKNIDGGAKADHSISKDKFFDRNYINEQIKTWFNQ